MNKALPKVKETKEELREMLKNERQAKKQNRIQALYLIVSKEATSRTQVANLLGFNRNSVSQWFKLYEAGGVAKMLELGKSSGPKPKITQEAMAEIEEILASEKGFRTYRAIHQLVVTKHQIGIGYGGVRKIVRYKLKAKAKVPRPTNPKKTKLKSANSEVE